ESSSKAMIRLLHSFHQRRFCETLGSLRPHKKLKAIKALNGYEEWEDIGDLAQALSQLFLHKDLPPLLEFSADSQNDTLDKQLLLLNELKIQESQSPPFKGHFYDKHLWSAEEVHVVLWEDALPTIRVAYGRYPIYAVTLMFPINLPPLSMSFSPFGQMFDEH